jgi:hypothetical protein
MRTGPEAKAVHRPPRPGNCSPAGVPLLCLVHEPGLRTRQEGDDAEEDAELNKRWHSEHVKRRKQPECDPVANECRPSYDLVDAIGEHEHEAWRAAIRRTSDSVHVRPVFSGEETLPITVA